MSTIALKNTMMSFVDEVTEGTAVAEAAAGACIFTADGLEFNISREMIESDEITGSLTETAPIPGMYSDDMGFSVTMNIRGKGTKSAPEWAIPMKSIMGIQNANTDEVVKAAPAPTTTVFTSNVGANDLDEGQLVLINDEVVRLVDITGQVFTVFPALTTTPIALDDIFAGISWMLASDDHPSFTTYIYFDNNLLRLRYAGCKTTNCEMSFEVGQIAKMAFTVKALTPTFDRTASVVTQVYDETTRPLMCLDITSKTLFAAVAKGTPTQIQTIITAPSFRARIGDTITIDVGAGVYETVAITGVTGSEGTDQTIAHASVSVAATTAETVYITHSLCAFTRDQLTVSIEIGDEAEKCMVSSSGFSGRAFLSRKVNIKRTPFFLDWQEFLLRDNVIGSELQVVLGDDANNIFCLHIPNQITGEASLTTDELMKVDVSSQAVKDATLGNDHEIVIAVF